MLRFHRFDPAPCGFPPPRVPLLAPPDLRQLRWRASAPARTVHRYARGRYALHAAYALAGVGPGAGLMAPAYHCRTMLDPALRLGAPVELYALTPALQPDLDALQRRLTAPLPKPAALLFTHYFGAPRDIGSVAALCEQHGVRLIEDCSHALATDADIRIGSTGHYAVSSPYKFYPCPDGGWLWANRGIALPPQGPVSPGLRAELRAFVQAWRMWRRPAQVPRADAVGPELDAVQAHEHPPGRDWIAAAETLSADYALADEGRRGSALSAWLQRHVDVEALARRRRRRHAEWVDAVAGLPGCRPWLADWPHGATPYMFALLIERPHEVFAPLKHLGLPIWRWDDMAMSDCAVSQRYRQGLLHLPCHQALSDEQMAWMTTVLAQVLRRR